MLLKLSLTISRQLNCRLRRRHLNGLIPASRIARAIQRQPSLDNSGANVFTLEVAGAHETIIRLLAAEFTADGLVQNYDADTGARLARRMIDRIHLFETNLSAFRSAILERSGDDRRADLYGTLMAGFWTVCHDQPVSAEEAAAAVEWLDAAQGGQLIVANRGSGIEVIYANSSWSKGAHAKRLKRLGGTNENNKAHKFHGVASKVMALPMSLVFPDEG